MTPEERAAIVSNAKYLRNVRPIDPDEITEYVESHPHPAVVRQVLRDEAVRLGLIERADGTFVPVPDAPVDPAPGDVERLPERYVDAIESILLDRVGPDWFEGGTGDRLRETIRRFKADYHRGRPVTYDESTALGYAIYHLPAYYAAIQYVLEDLVERRLLGRRLRVVDVGAGVGGPALGLHDRLPEDALVDYRAIEPSAGADILNRLLATTGRNFHATIDRETAEAATRDGPYDLILFANVLSELDDPVGVVRRFTDDLAADGSIVLLAPADRETSTGLRAVERSLVDDGLAVYSPTVRLWPGVEPTDRGWTFDVKPDLDVPRFQRRLDRTGGATGEFVNVDVQYSYAILRADGARRVDVSPDPDRYARMADMDRHVTARIDLLAVKLSHDLSEEGNPLFKIGDGSEQEDHYAVLTRPTTLNRDLETAEYGALLRLEGVLVLWNDDESAYNLVVDDETIVDRIAP